MVNIAGDLVSAKAPLEVLAEQAVKELWATGSS